jgi:hypothetical protein
MWGMRLLLFRPDLPSCSDCKKWMTNEDWSFTMRKGNDGRDHRVPNWDGKTPCRRCPKIPDDMPKVPESAQELSSKNRQAYAHYRECSAVNDWPRDAEGEVDRIVKRNAALFRHVEDEYAQHRINQPVERFLGMLKLTTPWSM